MKQKQLAKIFMITQMTKNPFGSHGLYKNISALQGLSYSHLIVNVSQFSTCSG